MSEIFFPKLEEENIKEIVCLGDLVDRRTFINFKTAYAIRDDLFIPALSRGITFSWIPGNHDITYRDSLEVNAAEVICDSAVAIYKTPQEVCFDGVPILFIPWVVKSTEEATLKAINETTAQIAFGHLELQGFEMNDGAVCSDGMNPDVYSKFDIVATGHFHDRNARGNIYYIGAASEQIWSDCNKQRGFTIFDTEHRSLEFVPNPFTLYQKLYYDDARGRVKLPEVADVRGKIIKVIVSGKNNVDQYEHFMGVVEGCNPLDVTVVEDHYNVNLTDDEEIVSEAKDTLEIIRDFVKQANNIVDVERLDRLVTELYNKALECD